MTDRINARLSKPLAAHVSCIVGTEGLYETPSDMESHSSQVYAKIIEGFEDINEGRFFESTGDWKKYREILKRKEEGSWEWDISKPFFPGVTF